MIRIGIYGYGNLGRGVEYAVSMSKDMELKAVFTRRDPSSVAVHTDVSVVNAEDVLKWKDEIDVMIICGGSFTDLPQMTPSLAAHFNVIDSFDTHARIPEHFASVDEACRLSHKTGIIAVGWDPGLFSLLRVIDSSVLPTGSTYTFWGKGVSQGHSDAIRRVPGVKDARQYTIPVESSLEAVRSGLTPELTTREKHTRECFVVLEEGADPTAVEQAIVCMPHYFDEYDTTVHFISEEELLREHSDIPHGGYVMHSAATGWEQEHRQISEFHLTLDSNPEFTSSVLTAYARAAYRMNNEGRFGAFSVLDVPPSLLSPLSPEQLRKELL